MKKILVFCFVIFSISQLTAQQLSVKSFIKLPNDLDARVNESVRDQNGDLCAIIKVVTTETGFSFDSGQIGIIKTLQKPAEIWVYVPFGAKRLTITHPVLGILRNYQIPIAIEKANVYEMVLVAGKVKMVVEEQDIITTWLTVKSNPEGADVYLNDIQKGVTPYPEKVKTGKYPYRIEKAMYYIQAGIIEITGEELNGKKELNVELRPAFGILKINSTPENGATVFIDEIEASGKTPLIAEKLKSGKHKVLVKKEMYQPKNIEVDILEGQTTEENISLTPNFANIKITSEPEAEVFMDGNKVGYGNFVCRGLAGIHSFVAKKESHYSDKKDREILPGSDISINFMLQPQSGNLDIVSTPIEATVFLNGVNKGTTPLTIKNLLIGNYLVTLKKDGYSTVDKPIEISEGKTTSISEKLKEGSGTGDFSNVEKSPLAVPESKSSDPDNRTDQGNGAARQIPDEIYGFVKIGTQIWMSENLRTTKFNDGTPIPLITSKGSWKNLTTPGYCWNDNDSVTNKSKYGALYNWYTINTGKLCPFGWHVPTNDEWTTLSNYLGGKNVSGGKMKEQGTDLWSKPNYGATNKSGFSALPGGLRYSNGAYGHIGNLASWWSSTEYSYGWAWYWSVGTADEGFGNTEAGIKQYGLSVRCLKNEL